MKTIEYTIDVFYIKIIFYKFTKNLKIDKFRILIKLNNLNKIILSYFFIK